MLEGGGEVQQALTLCDRLLPNLRCCCRLSGAAGSQDGRGALQGGFHAGPEERGSSISLKLC